MLLKDAKIENFDDLKIIIDKHRETPGCLMQIMQEAQQKYGSLPIEVQDMIANELNMPLTEIYGVATFYSLFTLEPKGEYNIGVCLGTACYVKGAQAIIDKISDKLGIKVGETTEDGKFTLEATRCVGACGLAPVMMINDDVYGRLQPKEIVEIIEKY
ncbi:NADH-quinone oxidoreductase subunit NuoE [Alkalibaculum sp. M08DMB]|uniref:NADH-quinone oxidoreductase subunit NuoE n=1 Tax=Alkalibaculum sporogenes TaxID=2655001 RepID=A0A6A7K5S4_9FIRM|nr:NADH-quinone oxidoreductase subunit NuoE [Alkalibaculum sporogenes]